MTAILSILSLDYSCFPAQARERNCKTEWKAQILFRKKLMGEGKPMFIDSHQHTHMIPLIFRTLLQVVKEENVKVASLRIPAEPLQPYLKEPSLYWYCTPTGIIKQ